MQKNQHQIYSKKINHLYYFFSTIIYKPSSESLKRDIYKSIPEKKQNMTFTEKLVDIFDHQFFMKKKFTSGEVNFGLEVPDIDIC